MTLLAPTVHLNGTSKDELLRLHMEARETLRVALLAFEATHPHGRDYYPQGPDAQLAASQAHREYAAQLRVILTEITTVAMVIHDQSGGR